MKKDRKVYYKLFTSTFYLSAFTFGGGFVIVPLMKKKFVDDLKWLDEKEMLNLTAIAQSSPGAVAVNASILVGYQIAGVIGGLLCILGTILPPLLILSVISLFYTAFKENRAIQALLKGFQSGVAAVIADVVLQMGSNIIKNKSLTSILIMVLSFFATYFLQINVIYVILCCTIIGAVTFYIKERRNRNSQPIYNKKSESEAHN